MILLEPIEWTLDGQVVPMGSDWSATASLKDGRVGGSDQFTGTAEADASGMAGVDQRSRLTGWRPTGGVLWDGFLDTAPKVSQGLAYLKAQGAMHDADAQGPPLLYQDRDYSHWTSGDPYPYIQVGTTIYADNQGGVLEFGIKDPTTGILNGEENYLAAWYPGCLPTRLAFSVKQDVPMIKTELHLSTAVGPDGTRDSRSTVDLSGASNFTVDLSWSSLTDDLVSIAYHVNADGTAPLRWCRLTDLRVNGLVDGDFFSPSDTAADMAGRIGWEVSRVQTSGTNALPLYWTASWLDFLSYLMMLDDWRTVIGTRLSHGVVTTSLDVGPWDTTWSVSTERNASESLEHLPLSNQVTVTFPFVNKTPGSVSVFAAPDPLAAISQKVGYPIIVTHVETLQDPQPNNHLALTLANALIGRVSQLQVRGSVEVAELLGDDGVASPYALQVGDRLNITDYVPAIPPQRVVGVTYTPHGVTAAVGVDVSGERLLANAANALARMT